jgi:hypothetical protein
VITSIYVFRAKKVELIKRILGIPSVTGTIKINNNITTQKKYLKHEPQNATATFLSLRVRPSVPHNGGAPI